MTTSNSITESQELYETTKSNIFWAIQKRLVDVLICQDGHIFLRKPRTDLIFGKIEPCTIEPCTFELKLFGFSGEIPIHAHEISFMLDGKHYEILGYEKLHSYSLLDYETF
jgi:hypothetical protein